MDEANMHQLDRIEMMLEKLTVGVPGDDQHLKKTDVRRNVIDMFDSMLRGQMIQAIKAYRTLTGLGLKESKDAIEMMMTRLKTRAVA